MRSKPEVKCGDRFILDDRNGQRIKRMHVRIFKCNDGGSFEAIDEDTNKRITLDRSELDIPVPTDILFPMGTQKGFNPNDPYWSNRVDQDLIKPRKPIWDDIISTLQQDENIETIILGCWTSEKSVGFDKNTPEPELPANMIATTLSPEEANPYMIHWSLHVRVGVYPFRIWTNKRVIWLQNELNGHTQKWAPKILATQRHPTQGFIPRIDGNRFPVENGK